MTELVKVDAHTARAVAGQIRQGIHDYLATLALISKAWEEGHWHVLSYDSWQAYVDGEFGADRLRLPAEHRAKAVAELRLAGMSTRAIGSALGVSHTEVGRQLRSGGTDVPPEVQGTDGKRYAASRPQTPATSPEPEPDGVDVAGSGHNLPSPDDDLAAGRTQQFDSVEEMDAALDAAGHADSPTGPVSAPTAEQSTTPDRSGVDPLDDPEQIAAAHRQRSSESVATALVSLFMRLDPDPVGWLTTTWQPDAYRNRDLPRVRDVFTTTGLRSIAKHIDSIADHLDRTGGSL